MADRYWIGFSDDSFNTAENWRDPAGAAGVPATTDSLFFINRTRKGCLRDMNQTAKNFALIMVGPRYNHNVGRGLDRLTCGATRVHLGGPRTTFLTLDTTFDFDEIDVYAGSALIDNTGVASADDVITVHNGIVELDGGAWGTANLQPRTPRETPRLRGNATLTELNVGGRAAQAIYKGNVTTLELRGGQFVLKAGTVTTVTQRGGVFDHRWNTTITTVDQFDGLFTFQNNLQARSTITITTFSGFKGTGDFRTNSGNVAFGTLTNAGAEWLPLFDAGKKLTLS